MRRLLASFAIFVTAHHPAPAQIPVTDITAIAKQAQQYLTQLQQLQTELNSYKQMITQGLALPMSIWTSVQADIGQVRNLANAASMLTGNSGSILTRLQSAGAYANQVSSLPQNIGAQFTMWQQTIGNAGNSLARTLGVQQGQESNYTALQAAIQAHSSSAAGQMQAIQSGNEALGLINTQLQQVQTTLVAAAQEQATRDIVAADREAVADAADLRILQYTPLPTTGHAAYGASNFP